MIYLLLGQDDYTKAQFILDLAKKHNAELAYFVVSDDLDKFSWAGEQDLFSKPKFSILRGVFKDLEKKYKGESVNLEQSGNTVIIEEKIDKRGALAKKILADKNVHVEQFKLPHQVKLDEWILNRVKMEMGKISKQGAYLLAKKLGRDDYMEIREGGRVADFIEAFSLWQADSEIKKLLSYSNGKEITEEDVERLVHIDMEIDSLEIANNLAENKKLAVFGLVENFLAKESTGDIKAGIIQLSALLAEQFRSIAIIQNFLQRNFNDQKILSLTSWKPGRLFMVKKAAKNFSSQKVKDFLNKLQALDAELKSSTLPPRVLLDLILSQLLSTV